MELKNICKSFGDKKVLSDFSAEFPAGSITVIMAPSGGGKTTLLRLILGLERPDAGEITDVPSKKSALFQEDRLCPELTVSRNIRMAVPGASPGQIREILAELGLNNSENAPANALSGGMARRAALVRALLYPGALLVLDEPFNGLDENSRSLAAAAIRKYAAGRTLLLVTHREEDAALLCADRIITL